MNAARGWKQVSLATRALFLVTLALLPIGGVALWQTKSIVDNQRVSQAEALVAVTETAALRERQIIERSIGAAAALAASAYSLRDDPELCTALLGRFERSNLLYHSVQYYFADGSSRCITGADASPDALNPDLTDLMARKELGLYREVRDDGQSIVIATPMFDGADYVGHLTLAIDPVWFDFEHDPSGTAQPLALFTFNHDGKLLTEFKASDAPVETLADTIDTGALASRRDPVFRDTTSDGETLSYATLALVPGAVYALGVWPLDATGEVSNLSYWRTMILAILMWLGSALVLFLIMQNLVIRDVTRLQRQVRDFRQHRALPGGSVQGRGELYDLEEDFRAMTETILQEEAELENSVHEKNVLLKEVHHRVKNNLQLINSIINMIKRNAEQDETKVVVSRLQDRVLALASVHRAIYQAQSMDRVQADAVISDIIDQSIKVGLSRDNTIRVTRDLDALTLYPDQAMPLTMLVSEGMTNALKYLGGADPFMHVSLKTEEPDTPEDEAFATLEIRNSVNGKACSPHGTGLGVKLASAFAMQLGGPIETEHTDQTYSSRVRFPISKFLPEPENY